MYLEIYQYDPNDREAVEFVQMEIRDFTNCLPQFKIVKTESILTDKLVTVHLWYVVKGI